MASLLKKRGAAQWACDLASELRCADCDESRRLTPAPPASTEDPPMLWEYLGMYVFEYEKDGSRMTAENLLMQDRASRLCMVRHLKDYPASENWEPSSADIRSTVITGWMAVTPTPTWIIGDSAPYFSSTEFSDFCARSGVGLLLAPGESPTGSLVWKSGKSRRLNAQPLDWSGKDWSPLRKSWAWRCTGRTPQ